MLKECLLVAPKSPSLNFYGMPSQTDLGRLRRLKRPSLRRRGGPRHRCPSHRHRCTDPGKTLAYTQPRGVVAAIDDPQGVKPRVIFVTCPLVPLTRRCFRLARGPLGGTAETPRTSCNSRVDGKISVIFPPFVHLSLRVRRSRPVRSEKRIDRTRFLSRVWLHKYFA